MGLAILNISRLKKLRKPIDNARIIFLASMFIAVLHNYTFFLKISTTYPEKILFQLSIFIIFICVINIVLNLITFSRATKSVLIIFLLFSALHAYFTDSFGLIGDHTMIRNIVKTDFAESLDLFSLRLVRYILLLGIVPAAIVYLQPGVSTSLKIELARKARSMFVSTVVISVLLFAFSKSYASFFREHKPLRYYANPVFFMYSVFKYFNAVVVDPNMIMAVIGADAKISEKDVERELVIFVLGETARSDRFSLNGYSRETNPYLKKEEVISFTDVHSCGTSTATSVPCMFSVFGRDAFDHESAAGSENLVDVLVRTGRINVLWRDNNSDSKGVALRVPFEDFKSPNLNTICDVECRDEGMLVGLQEYIDKQNSGDVFIVLHQMGNHGPAYYKRYPEHFEIFKPSCKSNDLGVCTTEEINNAYDNAIAYTDYFLSKVVRLLKNNNNRFETVMFYVSDHGESLGEKGLYLHGLPYSIAPIEQRKVPLIMWFGDSIKDDINISKVKAKKATRYTHDNVFHSILRLMEIETDIYDPQKDIIDYNYEY